MTRQIKNKIKAPAIVAVIGLAIYAIVGIIKFLGIKGLLTLGGLWGGYKIWGWIYKELERKDNETNNK